MVEIFTQALVAKKGPQKEAKIRLEVFGRVKALPSNFHATPRAEGCRCVRSLAKGRVAFGSCEQTYRLSLCFSFNFWELGDRSNVKLMTGKIAVQYAPWGCKLLQGLIFAVLTDLHVFGQTLKGEVQLLSSSQALHTPRKSEFGIRIEGSVPCKCHPLLCELLSASMDLLAAQTEKAQGQLEGLFLAVQLLQEDGRGTGRGLEEEHQGSKEGGVSGSKRGDAGRVVLTCRDPLLLYELEGIYSRTAEGGHLGPGFRQYFYDSGLIPVTVMQLGRSSDMCGKMLTVTARLDGAALTGSSEILHICDSYCTFQPAEALTPASEVRINRRLLPAWHGRQSVACTEVPRLQSTVRLASWEGNAAMFAVRQEMPRAQKPLFRTLSTNLDLVARYKLGDGTGSWANREAEQIASGTQPFHDRNGGDMGWRNASDVLGPT
ncbi:unnamed protein product [Symbiodinium microadriaticum]|nr:unnamed protein product [Symbiodinium microadriaticum]